MVEGVATVIPRINRFLPQLIALNLVVAVALLIAGDGKNASLGLMGAGLFIAALILTERA